MKYGAFPADLGLKVNSWEFHNFGKRS